MKTHRSISLLAALATLLAMPIAIAATEATKPDAKKAVATVATAEEMVVKLTPKQRLPKNVKQLTIIDRELGDKNAAAVGTDNAVLVHYTGWLYDPGKPDGKGEKFDSSLTRQLPFGFFVNAGKVIKGWDLGIVGMKPKGKRTLIIPPALAYRDVARPNIPANSTLLFDVELIDIVGKREAPVSAAATASAAPAAVTPPPPPVPPAPPAPIVRLTPKDALPAAPVAITAIDESPGDGPAAETGNDVMVHYTGWLYDASLPAGKGKQFDSSRQRDQLFRFKLGEGRVIKGWDQGVVGMKVKGKRTLIIPAEFGYGARGAGGGLIPPGATLIFDVELVEIPAPVPVSVPVPVPAKN